MLLEIAAIRSISWTSLIVTRRRLYILVVSLATSAAYVFFPCWFGDRGGSKKQQRELWNSPWFLCVSDSPAPPPAPFSGFLSLGGIGLWWSLACSSPCPPLPSLKGQVRPRLPQSWPFMALLFQNVAKFINSPSWRHETICSEHSVGVELGAAARPGLQPQAWGPLSSGPS